MKTTRIAAFALLAVLGFSISVARADDPQEKAQARPAPAPVSRPSSKPTQPSESAQSSDDSAGPHVGPLRITDVSVIAGRTEEGLATGASVSVGTAGGSTAELDLVGGKPVLRVNGQVSAIPLKILERKIKRKDGEVSVSLTFVPLTGDVSLNISSIDHTTSFDAFLRPTLQSEIDASRGPVSGSVTARIAPAAGGVVNDGKGTRASVGSNLGLDVTLSVRLSETNRVDLALSLDKYIDVAGALVSGPDISGKVTFVHRMPTGQEVYAGGAGYTQRLDILRKDVPILGDTRAKMVSAIAGVAW